MLIQIRNVADGTASVEIEATEEQYQFLCRVALELEKEENREKYSPCLMIEPELTCRGCGRAEGVCSRNPCPDVIADRES